MLRYLLSPWTDPDSKKSSHGDSLLVLDGLRAAPMVVAAIFLSGDDFVGLFAPGLSLNAWTWPGTWAMIFSVFLIAIVRRQDSFIARAVRAWPIRHLGLLSYGFYLFHMSVMIAINNIEMPGLFFAVFAGSYVAAIVSHLLIEKPALQQKKLLSRISLQSR